MIGGWLKSEEQEERTLQVLPWMMVCDAKRRSNFKIPGETSPMPLEVTNTEVDVTGAYCTTYGASCA